ncbi:MAG: PaaI family thioesterase [Candidatus Lambdaproteobacteria bacterium]|nr:PaaI family thioesterase [Candidatus Lambdaproteobacteria bacterium]
MSTLNDRGAPQPRDAHYAARVTDSFQRQGFMRHIRARIVRLEPGYCEIHVPHQAELTQQHGFFHGGIIGTLADNAGGYAAYTLMPADASILTVEFKVNLLAPGDGDLLIGRSRVTRSGCTLSVCHSQVFVRKAGVETLCAEGLVTLIALPGRPDQPVADSGLHHD